MIEAWMNELEGKLNRIRTLLSKNDLDGILLNKISSFAWATCGASSYVNTAAAEGAASLLITQDRQFVLTNNIESTRIEMEEKLGIQGWEISIAPWYEGAEDIFKLAGSTALGADGYVEGYKNLGAEITQLRMNLMPEEGERFRELGKICAEAMDAAIRNIQPGMTEYQIAARLGSESQSRGVQAIVNLIAADERIFYYRHPLPTNKRLDHYAMLVLCGRKYGLVCSITRLVHFGRLPEELLRKSMAVAQVDAALISASRPGKNLGEIFSIMKNAYTIAGFPDEWKLHHQGGPAGYEPRELVATANNAIPVLVGQAYAWNPSITGTKSEDTILIGETENEVLTKIQGWPTIKIETDGKAITRPAILEIL